MTEEIYTKMTLREQILYNPHMYIGPAVTRKQLTWVCEANDTDARILWKEIQLSTGLLGVFDEILVNAADNYHHSMNDRPMSEIRVGIESAEGKLRVSVRNDGRGIPVRKHADYDMYVPQFIFSELLTSSNYQQTSRVTGGMNGYGAKLTNILSRNFYVETFDSSNGLLYKQTFSDNMSVIGAADISTSKQSKDYTLVRFEPDLEKLGVSAIDDDLIAALTKRVYDIAGNLPPTIAVFINNARIPISSFKDYCVLYRTAPVIQVALASEQVLAFVGLGDGSSQHVSFVNNVCTLNGGSHVEVLLGQIVKRLRDKLRDAHKFEVKPQQIRSKLQLFVSATIPNPKFTTQSKDQLCTPESQLKSICTISNLDKVCAELLKAGLKDVLADESMSKQMSQMHKALKGGNSRQLDIPKLEDANFAGTKKSKQCTLILTEGDSAKSLAMAGLEVVGRDYYGVFPLKGKFLNVRDSPPKKIAENAEIQNLVKIIGLDVKQDAADALRYGALMIMADQDCDGSHIKGLIINFIQFFWPNLCKQNFLKYFITPLIKAQKGSQVLEFFNADDFHAWQAQTANASSYKVKYYKGLGTSTSAEAKQYFSEKARYEKQFIYANQDDELALSLAFAKQKADDRKQWLASSRLEGGLTNVDYSKQETSVAEFVNRELILFSLYDCQRSIPSVVDGLKPGQRKILFACFKRNLTQEIKVAQLAGYVAEQSAYHHGEQSLCQTIVQLAQDHTGTNNVNLLVPSGQFGNRNMGNDGAASPRYIFTYLNPIVDFIFAKEDFPVLRYLEDEGQSIEPVFYTPVIPMVLVNGALGIGTGWSTSVPQYNPVDLAGYLKAKLSNAPTPALVPWFRDFCGCVLQETDGSFVVRGKIEVNASKHYIDILEIPPDVTIQDYKRTLVALQPDHFRNFTEHHHGNRVHFRLHEPRANLTTADSVFLIKMFKLQSKIAMSNMVLFDSTQMIRKYGRVEDILDEFFQVRRTHYELRRAHQIDQLERQVLRLQQKRAFIEHIRTHPDTIGKAKQELMTIAQQIANQSEVEFLVKIPVYDMTLEKIQSLDALIADTTQNLHQLKTTHADQMWVRDLDLLISKLSANHQEPPKQKKRAHA